MVAHSYYYVVEVMNAVKRKTTNKGLKQVLLRQKDNNN